MRLPSLNALRAFEVTARLLSVTKAAETLHVTQSAVSRQIRALEEELGVRLFLRLHRAIRLSPEGEALAASLSDAFDRIARGVEQVRSRPDEVRVRVLPTVGTRWLLPRLRGFEADNPEIKVRVSVLWDSMTPDDAEHDLGIVLEHVDRWPAARPIGLFRERLTPVCSPDYLARHGTLVPPGPLDGRQLLHCASSPDWRLWADHAGFPPPDESAGEIFDTMDMALRAAERGRGMAVADLAMIVDDLALGRLVVASPVVMRDRTNYHLVRRDPARRKPAVERFVAWLIEEARKTDEGVGIEPPDAA